MGVWWAGGHAIDEDRFIANCTRSLELRSISTELKILARQLRTEAVEKLAIAERQRTIAHAARRHRGR